MLIADSTDFSAATLDAHDFALLFDLLKLIELTLPTARARFARFGPGFGTAEIGIPERPRTTLPRSLLVNSALAFFTVEENAVPVRKLLQRLSNTNLHHVGIFKGLLVHVLALCKSRDLGFVHPDETRSSRTTVTTLRTLKLETFVVPRLRFL